MTLHHRAISSLTTTIFAVALFGAGAASAQYWVTPSQPVQQTVTTTTVSTATVAPSPYGAPVMSQPVAYAPAVPVVQPAPVVQPVVQPVVHPVVQPVIQPVPVAQPVYASAAPVHVSYGQAREACSRHAYNARPQAGRVVQDGFAGALVGAGLGAAIGAIADGGNGAGKGAAIGSLVGLTGGALQGNQREQHRTGLARHAFYRCMAGYGY